MTREEAIEILKRLVAYDSDVAEAKQVAIEALSAEAVSEDTQTEERAIFVAKETELAYIEARLENAEKRLQELPKYTNCTEFIEWLTEVVLNDEDWELNAVAYGEVIARKLKKLGLLEVKDGYYIRHIENNATPSNLVYKPSVEAVPIHEDGTLEVKVPNAQKVGRVLVMDTDSHIGGGLFYPESAEAVQGEWIDIDNYYRLATCSHCHKVTMFEKWGEYTKPYDFCPNCGAKMHKGGDVEWAALSTEKTQLKR